MSTTEASLLEAIYAAPDDDGPRVVYSDWLQERSDPRGEFIALQIARARREPSPAALKRERSLEKKHRAAWLGAVWDLVYRVPFRGPDRDYPPTFERGFLAEAVTSFRDGKLKKASGDPRWSTVRTLLASDNLLMPDGSLWPAAHAFYLHDVFRNLVTFENAHPLVAKAFAEDARPRRIQRLGTSVPPGDDLAAIAWRGSLSAAVGLPALTELALYIAAPFTPTSLSWLLESPLGARLRTLELRWAIPIGTSIGVLRGAPEIAAWTARNRVPSNIEEVRLLAGLYSVTLRRQGAVLVAQAIEPRHWHTVDSKSR